MIATDVVMQFSTSLELESDNVCLYVCLSVRKLWGSLQSPKWLDLAEFGTLVPWVNT